MEKLFEKLKEYWKITGLAGLALVAGSVFYFLNQPQNPPETQLSTVLTAQNTDLPTASSAKEKTPPSSSDELLVDLKGAVVKPDVYKISADDRVNDLIKMAGGFTAEADLKTVNLAAKLKDEEIIYVARKDEKQAPVADSSVSVAGASSTTATPAGGAKVNINTADLTQLQTLSGVGAKKAQDIIDYRTQNGNFQSIDDLGKVSGFGEKTLAKLKDSISVD